MGEKLYSNEIIDTRFLLKEITESLISLLYSLKTEEWDSATCYPNWTVKDIVAHLFQTGVNRLSRQRDLYPSNEKPIPITFASLSDLINQSNNQWTGLLHNISPQLLVNLLEISETQLVHFFHSLDLKNEAFYPVMWAGETQSLNWFDIGREYTERWHHQQQIREALGVPTIAIPRFLTPVIKILMLSVPYWYENISAKDGTRICIEVTGESGSFWLLEKEETNWSIIENSHESYDEKITLSDDTAWRFLMRSISKTEINRLIKFSSTSVLCDNFLNVKSIMMNE